MKLRASLVELWTRVIKYVETDKIYTNGGDNLYPYEIERVILNSPTAKRSANMMAKFISGNGIEGENIIVNKKKNLKLTNVIRRIARDISYQNGCFIHVTYKIDENGNITADKLDVLDYTKCRISKEDDEQNKGKIYYKDYAQKKSFGKSQTKEKWFYPFSNSQEVITAQINNDTKKGDLQQKIENYRGQVFYLNLNPDFQYAISKFDQVFNDCDTEYRMSLYSNTMTRGGFLGKTAVILSGLDEEDAKEEEKNVKAWLGSENSSSLYFLSVDEAEDLEKVMKIIQVESQYDDDMFTNTEKRLRRNILGAANNIPEALIYATEGALFGSSGTAYREMKEFYEEQTEEERNIIEETMKMLGFPVKIKSIIDPLDIDPKVKGKKDGNNNSTE